MRSVHAAAYPFCRKRKLVHITILSISYLCLLYRSELPHPVPPDTLNLDWRMNFSPQLVCNSFPVRLVGVFSPASQASMSSWTFAILKDVIIIVFVLSIINSYRATLRSSGYGSILGGGLGEDRGEQRISIKSKTGSIA